jgi:hypothetical protein
MKGEGLKGATVDEGCNRVMEDMGEMDGGGNGNNRETNKPGTSS